jgi:integrase
MPKTKRPQPLYRRGGFALYPRPGRNHEIIWYDVAAGRERSASAGTTEIDAAVAAVDRKFIEVTRGVHSCPTCNRPFAADSGRLVTEAIELARHDAQGKPSAGAINARLDHVVAYIETLPSPAVFCHDVDSRWMKRFRKWAEAQPIVTPSGRHKPRALSTVENSVLQLAAAIRGIGEKPAFRTIPVKELNRTPEYRADIAKLAAMLRYAMEPGKRREHLLSFLRASIVTMGRPDAVLDISTAKERAQWNSEHAVLALNPKGRRQTRKRRATVPIAKQATWLLDECKGFLIPVSSIKTAWNGMASELGLPGDGEAGCKLIRRSVAHIIRGRLHDLEKSEDELEVFLGHRVIDSTSELYAPFRPTYLRTVKGLIEGLIDELETLAPGAFYRSLTATGGNVASIKEALNR